MRRKHKKPKYDPNSTEIQWAIGMKFDTTSDFKQVVTKYVIATGHPIWFKRIKPRRVRVLHADTCEQMLYASKNEKGELEIKLYNFVHECYKSMRKKW